VRFRSDIYFEGGDHSAHFLGTGVVRAHATESCGIKGCRILLHPTAAALIGDPNHNPLPLASGHVVDIECASGEQQHKSQVAREVNFWSFRPTEERNVWHALQEMWDRSPEAQHQHYQATAEARSDQSNEDGKGWCCHPQSSAPHHPSWTINKNIVNENPRLPPHAGETLCQGRAILSDVSTTTLHTLMQPRKLRVHLARCSSAELPIRSFIR
jgi:hypothetical protein